MSVVFIEYPSCSTCKKAKKWLDEHGIAYTGRHIVEQNPSADELGAWVAQSGLGFRKFFNTSGKLYRELAIKDKLDAGMNETEALELLSGHGMLVKRPLVIGDGFVLVGFREQEWVERLLA